MFVVHRATDNSRLECIVKCLKREKKHEITFAYTLVTVDKMNEKMFCTYFYNLHCIVLFLQDNFVTVGEDRAIRRTFFMSQITPESN